MEKQNHFVRSYSQVCQNEILIIGGGIIGLALAVELRSHGASVSVLCRDFKQAAAHAAAGMLAPEAEEIPPGAMLDLCKSSRQLYPEWIKKLSEITGLDTNYWACGILAPMYEEPVIKKSAQWLDKQAIHQHQPGLSAEVIGGWWYPQDGQVDNRALAHTLWVAAQQLGVEFCEDVTVEEICHKNGKIISLKTNAGEWQAQHYILATGAWSQELLPIPVSPKKGQMLSVKVPVDSAIKQPLKQVLFGNEIYIVPRQDGRIVIGATSEDVRFTPNNTPAGIQSLLTKAIRLYPELQHFPIQEFWWGFRPNTPDEMPILGSSPYENLTLATGHYRNGILLAPVTASLITDVIMHQKNDVLIQKFHYSRFTES